MFYKAVCCYTNGNIRFWDLKSGKTTYNLVNAHDSDIICMDLSADSKILVTAGVDMKVNVITTSNGKIVWKFTVEVPAPMEETEESDDNNNMIENSIESVGICKTLAIVACCTVNGQVFLWDLNTHALRHKFAYDVGFSKIMWDEKEKLFASALDGTVHEWDGRSMELIKKYEGHESEVLDFCLNKNILLTASQDQSVKVFHIQ